MARKWFTRVRVSPELLRDPVALDQFLVDSADFYAPAEGVISPRITRLLVRADDQDDSIYTVIQLRGVDDGPAAQA